MRGPLQHQPRDRVRGLVRRLAVCLAILPACVHAGALRVGPTRVELTRQKPVALIEVRNDNPDPVLIQVERVTWVQQNGLDSYPS